jgi:bifunctional ADP-heptose synthase (sugar kinase/adenylyltransferase)
VDTTGAGDAFNGALAAGLAEGRGLVDAATRAVAAAGVSTSRMGARGGMPTSAELVLVEPAVTEPAATEPAATEPAATEPGVAQSAATPPGAAQPTSGEPAVAAPEHETGS